MHLLTKIFIVLVSLLAVFLVPLVVVYATNEDNFKTRYLSADSRYRAEQQLVSREREAAGAREATMLAQIEEHRSAYSRAVQERDSALVEVRQLESRLAVAQSGQAEIKSDLRKLAEGVAAATNINQSQLDELRALRSSYMNAERRLVELDEAYRDISGQLEVAVAARRALQEELQRVNEQRARTEQQLSEFVARFGPLSDERDAVALAIVPDRNLETRIIAVRRSPHQVLVEIGAGSRDGIREGWTMTIGRNNDFLAKVRIIDVDITTSTGVVLLEDERRGLVDVGDRVNAWAGMD